MSSITNMSDDARSLTVLEHAAHDRRCAADNLRDCARVEHEAVWQAVDAGASWADLAWLVGEPLTLFYARHRDRGRPRIERVVA